MVPATKTHLICVSIANLGHWAFCSFKFLRKHRDYLSLTLDSPKHSTTLSVLTRKSIARYTMLSRWFIPLWNDDQKNSSCLNLCCNFCNYFQGPFVWSCEDCKLSVYAIEEKNISHKCVKVLVREVMNDGVSTYTDLTSSLFGTSTRNSFWKFDTSG